MKFISTLFILFALSFTAITAESNSHWSYQGKTGPASWGSLDSDYSLCETGKNQSPINITNAIKASLSELNFDYVTDVASIKNNGHSIQTNIAEGSSVVINAKTFNLLQFHFHSPSEHHVNGNSYPLEVHFVHADKDMNLAVVGVFFEESSEENNVFKDILKMAPKKEGEKKVKKSIDYKRLIPNDKSYYRLNGSLTTPPCSEGVTWVVMKEIQPISKKQVDKYYKIFGFDANRPVQPLNARVVAE
jgi:carbonic anhydrase